ncbi:hypothetical protein Lalb_Chr24g0403321 [Lupinus albus]|uniref:Uncharacterized protein n=1 Tax=Lupinus albus TaxID=3870 RepID=A0A6A4N5F1_LUPAL|nr:hypothetical protein Lalb_Chr24g0403321 [Lupinus albus]
MKKSLITLCFFMVLFVFASGLEDQKIGINAGEACKRDNDCFCRGGMFPICCYCTKGHCFCANKDGREVPQSYANVPKQIP